MEESGTGGRAGFYAGSDSEEFEIRNFTSRPRTQEKNHAKKIAEDNTTASPVISRSFGNVKKLPGFNS